MARKYLDVANFVCNFAEVSFLECIEDRIVPLLSMELGVSRSETYKVLFVDWNFLTLDGTPCLVGRLVERKKLKAHQRLKPRRGLVKTRATMDSDPSTLFVLMLVDHRLLLVREVPRSPDIKKFEDVFRRFLEEHRIDVRKGFIKAFKNQNGISVLNKEARAKFDSLFEKDVPPASFHITPIGSREAAEEILVNFAKIKNIKLTAREPNNEDFDLDEELLEILSQKRAIVKGASGVVQFSAKGPDGLEQAQVKSLVIAASDSSGHCSFEVNGSSEDGHSIKKTNLDSRVRLSIDFSPNETMLSKCEKAVRKFNEAVENDLFKLGSQLDEVQRLSMAKKIVSKFGK